MDPPHLAGSIMLSVSVENDQVFVTFSHKILEESPQNFDPGKKSRKKNNEINNITKQHVIIMELVDDITCKCVDE